ncbi:MAG: hypothetical protein Q6361_08115 [Candidatus Hermodarchaeota archaeon]|nr:hypothetical protein [Candidatus Hermodarchaeota archaeon]
MPKIPKGASPQKVGQMHYDAAMKGDRTTWEATLTKRNQHTLDHRGTPFYWWDTACQRAEIGVRYDFDREDKVTDTRAKLFYKRFNEDGSHRGKPVPLTLIKEEGEWRIHIASY